MNHGKNVGFNFSRYGAHCTHKSGDVVNFTTVACRISSRLKCYKNYKNWLRSAKVIVKNKLPHFFMVHCVLPLLLLLHPFNSRFSSTTWVSQHQKGKPFWILLE